MFRLPFCLAVFVLCLLSFSCHCQTLLVGLYCPQHGMIVAKHGMFVKGKVIHIQSFFTREAIHKRLPAASHMVRKPIKHGRVTAERQGRACRAHGMDDFLFYCASLTSKPVCFSARVGKYYIICAKHSIFITPIISISNGRTLLRPQ